MLNIKPTLSLTGILCIFLVSNEFADGQEYFALSKKYITKIEYTIKMPIKSENIKNYARYYGVITPKNIDDIPFSTLIDQDFNKGHRILFGVFARPGGVWNVAAANIYVVSKKNFPVFVHGGCRVVNFLYDLDEHKQIGAWCNFK